MTRVAPEHFQLQAAICPGDLGGPAVSLSTGRILGVVSRSVMDGDESSLGLTELSRLDALRAVFASAALVAEGAGVAELPPGWSLSSGVCYAESPCVARSRD